MRFGACEAPPPQNQTKNKQTAHNLKQPILEKVFCNHLKCYFFSYISYDETVLIMKNRANDILKKESTTFNNNL